jgi:hypothetical protein
VVGLRCIKFRLTLPGRDYVSRDWQKDFIDLDTLKENSKLFKTWSWWTHERGPRATLRCEHGALLTASLVCYLLTSNVLTSLEMVNPKSKCPNHTKSRSLGPNSLISSLFTENSFSASLFSVVIVLDPGISMRRNIDQPASHLAYKSPLRIPAV